MRDDLRASIGAGDDYDRVVVSKLFVEGFWSKVDRRGSCWLWAGGIRNGYPIYRGRLAARVSFEVAYGAIPERRHVRRRCSSRTCVNPEHLIVGDEHVKRPIHVLSKLQADDIRARRVAGETVIELARRYAVTEQHVRGIVRGHSWNATKPPASNSYEIVRVVTGNGGDDDVLTCGHRVRATPWPNRRRRCRECP